MKSDADDEEEAEPLIALRRKLGNIRAVSRPSTLTASLKVAGSQSRLLINIFVISRDRCAPAPPAPPMPPSIGTTADAGAALVALRARVASAWVLHR